MLQFAFRREFAPPVQIEFAVRQQAAVPAASCSWQAQSLVGQAGFGEQAEGGGAQVDGHPVGRRPVSPTGAGQAGGAGWMQLPGVEAGGLQVELGLSLPTAIVGSVGLRHRGRVAYRCGGLLALRSFQRRARWRAAGAGGRAAVMIGQLKLPIDAVRFGAMSATR